jgi:putative transposase
MISLYYREDRATKPAMVYRLAESALDNHTQHHWIDLCKCGPEVPQKLMKELVQVLNGELPMQAILDNSENKGLLCEIKEMPSTGFFYQYLKWFEAQPEVGRRVMNSRYGDGTWEQLYMVFDTFANLAAFPLQYVFADHYLLDVFTIDEATRSRIDRLWVTMLIDVYSRSILGMALLYEEPCIDSIQSALLHAIWPKSSHKELGIDGEWVSYGIPQQLFLDNAWAHDSHSLENLARVIGQGGKYQTIDLVLRPPYKARYGALIESLFGNLSSRIKQELPGAIQSSDPKHVRAAAKKACLLYDDIYCYLQQFIVRYQNTEHDGIGRMTPHQKWMEGMQMGWPDVPPLTPSVRRLFLRMWPDTRTITEKGVCAFGMHYSSPALGAATIVDRQGQKVQYSFRYNPADISTIALFQEERWIGDISAKELRRPDGTLKPTSLWELNMAKDLAKDARGKTEDWVSYLNAAEQLKKLRQGERDKVRRKLKQNLQEEGENASIARDKHDVEELELEDDEYQTRLLADFGS